MGYIATEEVKAIRTAIKKAFPGFKFSITRQHYSSVCVIILSGPVDLGKDHKQLNTYYLEDIEKTELREMAEKIQQIIFSVRSPKYRETGDYGNQPDFYHYIHLGEWSRPYEVTQ